MRPRDTVITEILDGNVGAFERLRKPGSNLTIADAQQLIVDTIERMERTTLGHIAVADALLRIACDGAGGDRPVRILEVAAGSGWLLCNLWTRARRRGIDVALTGSDLNADLVASMQRRVSRAKVPATVRVANACDMSEVPDGAYHLAVMAFTLHHFPTDDALRALRELDRVSSGGMVVLDPMRRVLALAVMPLMATMLAPSGARRFAFHDAHATVRRSYTPTELRHVVRDCELDDRYQVGALPTLHPERFIAQAIWPRGPR